MIFLNAYTLQILISMLLLAGLVFPVLSQTVEEYRVYDAAINKMLAGGKITFDTRADVATLIIADTTVQNFSSGGKGENWKYVKEAIPGLTDETIADYESRNGKATTLQKSFQIDLKYQIISQKELTDIFKKAGGGGWEKFYSSYPKSGGYVSLSRAGMNKSNTQALLYFQHSCGSLCATGFYMLLRRAENGWEVEKTSMLWIS